MIWLRICKSIGFNFSNFFNFSNSINNTIMLKNYIKQAWTLMRQNRLFTGIYVVGTGLSIALVMTLFIIFYVKFGPVYPEYNRDRTLVLKPLKRYPKGKPEYWSINGGVAYYVVDQLLQGLPHVEQVAGCLPDFWDSSYQVSATDVKPFKAVPRFANEAFWKVFSFRFIEGQPFTQADVEAKATVAVLSESLAKRLFATAEGVTGRHFAFNGRDYRVCGVVEDVSNATPASSADLWLPLLNLNYVRKELDSNGLMGNVYAYLLVDDEEHIETVRAEVQDVFRRYSQQDKDYGYDLMEQPDVYWLSTFRQNFAQAPDIMEIAKDFLYLLLALLFIPALNLSGMISSRMDSRIAELGIRKAYGATRRRLLEQVLCENLLLTLLGGLTGLLFSYLIVLTASDWILTLFDKNIYDTSISTSLTPEMLFNPAVFGSTLAVCLVLNVVSALVPALWALRHPIMESLNTKR